MYARCLPYPRPFCHGHKTPERCENAALFEVLTEAALHYYCRDCLPRKYRALVGLGTVPPLDSALRETFRIVHLERKWKRP